MNLWSYLPKNFFFYFLLIVLVYFPLFSNLDSTPMRIYDEAFSASSALEMLANGNWSVTHFNGHPDMWFTKPPLMIWLQAIC